MLLLKSKQVPLEFHSEPKLFKKYHKIKYKNMNSSHSVQRGGSSLLFSASSVLTSKQLLVVLKLIKPILKDCGGRVHLPINVDTPLTRKPKDIRMGRGKGPVFDKVFLAKCGSTYFNLYKIKNREAAHLLRSCLAKLAKSKIIISNQ